MPDRRATVAAVVALVTVGAVAIAGCGNSTATSATTTTPKRSVATVTKRDLSQTKSETGTVGYGNADTVKLSGSSSAAEVGTTTTTTTVPVASTRTGAAATASSAATTSSSATSATGSGSSAGVITSLPAVDSVVDRNGSLVEINGYPAAVLMFGDRPMWRTLQDGVPDGPDVEQLEENLAALGYSGFTVDQTFTSGTAAAVEKWQGSLGLPETGIVLRDDVVFQPGAVRIAGWSAQPGDAATGAALTVTSTARIVTVDLSQTDAALGVPGASVSITPATGPAVTGTIFTTATETASSSGSSGGAGGAGASGGSSATTTTHVTIVVPPGTELGDGSVSVDFTTSTAAGVLAVPVKALLALAEGGYAVERVEGSGTKLVPVTPGSFANGYVQVSGPVSEGDRVIVP